MKKALSLLLILVMTLALIPSAFAEEAEEPAAFTPVEGTPYGIPLFESIDDVDFAAVVHGHSLRRLLDLVDNIEVKEDMTQNSQGQSFGMIMDTYYFLDDGQYVSYSEQEDQLYHSMSYQLFLYDKDDPYYYARHMGGRDKIEVQAEYIDAMLDSSFIHMNPDIFTFDVTSAEVVDGLYVYKFDMVPRTDLGEGVVVKISYSDCSLTIDPETSLIRGYTYDRVSEYGEQIISAVVNYNVDKQPDYSLKY